MKDIKNLTVTVSVVIERTYDLTDDTDRMLLEELKNDEGAKSFEVVSVGNNGIDWKTAVDTGERDSIDTYERIADYLKDLNEEDAEILLAIAEAKGEDEAYCELMCENLDSYTLKKGSCMADYVQELADDYNIPSWIYEAVDWETAAEYFTEYEDSCWETDYGLLVEL